MNLVFPATLPATDLPATLGRQELPPAVRLTQPNKPASWNGEVNAIISHLHHLRESVQIDNQELGLALGDITSYVQERFNVLFTRLEAQLSGLHGRDLEQRLDQVGYPFVAIKDTPARLYITQQQYLVLNVT